MAEKKIKISELIPDSKNFNVGTQYGQHLIEESLRKFGAGRSILLDRNNNIIAGNKTIENAAAIGMENVVVVETTGDQIVAVKRTDIDLDTKQGREMALADNATAAANLRWDEEALQRACEEYELAPKDWGVDVDSLDFFEVDNSDIATGGSDGGESAERIIIVFKEEQRDRVAALLGLEELSKPVYNVSDLRYGSEKD